MRLNFALSPISFSCFYLFCLFVSSDTNNDLVEKASAKSEKLIFPNHNPLKGDSSRLSVAQKTNVSLSNSTKHEKYDSCPSCQSRELLRNHTINEVKNHILKSLGMQNGPPARFQRNIDNDLVDKVFSIQKYSYSTILQNLPQESHNEKEGSDSVIILAENPIGHIPDKISSNWDIQYFSVEPLLSRDFHVVAKAILNIFVPSLPKRRINYPFQTKIKNISQSINTDEEEIWIEVQYLKRNQKLQNPIFIQTDVIRNKVSNHNGGWVQLDVTEIINSVWLNNPKENMGLHLQVKTKSGLIIPVGIQHQTTNIPFLQIGLQEKKSQARSKRSIAKKCKSPEDDNNQACCLWEFDLDFERDLGWGHWVISPSKMRINSCKGACDLGVMAPEHLYNDIMQKSNKNFRPCCTPRKMSPVNIYYRESEGSFKTKSLENMTVEQCGCGSRP